MREKMFEVTQESFGPSQTELDGKWRSVARSLLGEEQDQNDEKICLLREAVLAREELAGLRDSHLVRDDGFLRRYSGRSQSVVRSNVNLAGI